MKVHDIEISKAIFNYAPRNALEMTPYIGPKSGYSTEKAYGGTWLIHNINTPLSTSDVYTCSTMNAIDEQSGKQLLFHVMERTVPAVVAEFLQKHFPNFSKVNIYCGNQLGTIKTTKLMLEGIDRVNPQIKPIFYYSKIEDPEIVAYNGQLFTLQSRKDKNHFTEIINPNIR